VGVSGSHAFVGVPGDSSDHEIPRGFLYAYERTPGGWVFQQRVDAGAAYVYERVAGQGWVETVKLTASDEAADARFGEAVSLSGDAIWVGTPRRDLAYVFERDDQGTPADRLDDLWPEVARFELRPEDFGESYRLGHAVGVSGSHAFVGVPGDSSDHEIPRGFLYAYERTPGGWVFQQRVDAPAGLVEHLFGTSLALSGDLGVVGSYGFMDYETVTYLSGYAYVYRWSGAAWELASWFPSPDGQPDGRFALHTAISGETALVGDYRDDSAGKDSGSAYAYEVLGSSWESYCTTSPNSVGPGARITVGGSMNTDLSTFLLKVTEAVPYRFGTFFYGPDPDQVPLADGTLCVGPGSLGLFRLPALALDWSGGVEYAVDFTVPPAGSGKGKIDAGSTWNFQFWYRDPMGPGGSGSNLTDAVRVTFCN